MIQSLTSGFTAPRTLVGETRAWLGQALTLWPILVAFFGMQANGQANLQVRYQDNTGGGPFQSVESLYTGGMLTVVDNFGNGDRVSESARISDLDLEGPGTGEYAANRGVFFVQFSCKGQDKCVSKNVPNCTITPGCQSQVNDNIEIVCNTSSECEAFLNALKQEQAPKRVNPENRTPQPQARSLPAVVSAPTGSQPAAQSQTAAQGDLNDLLASIGWLSSAGGSGTNKSALDDLLRHMRPGQRPVQSPTIKPTYAAFSQAGGFDANGAWGAGTGADLNSAIGMASGNCSQRAQTGCDDQGYCMLRPGLWGAWASDLKVAGNSAFTCNAATEEAARAQAQAWCGSGCQVLWSGVGQ